MHSSQFGITFTDSRGPVNSDGPIHCIRSLNRMVRYSVMPLPAYAHISHAYPVPTYPVPTYPMLTYPVLTCHMQTYPVPTFLCQLSMPTYPVPHIVLESPVFCLFF